MPIGNGHRFMAKEAICSEPGCSKLRGGRNTRCWAHLKQLVRRNAAIRSFQVMLDVGTPDIPAEYLFLGKMS